MIIQIPLHSILETTFFRDTTMKPHTPYCLSLLAVITLIPMLGAFQSGWTQVKHDIDPSRILTYTRSFPVPVEKLWDTWTTTQGIQTFFSQSADINLRPGGNYHIIFQPAAPKGERGAEDSTVLCYIPQRMLTFTWSAPPAVPDIRALGAVCWVTLEFNAIDESSSQLTLTHLGFGNGDSWKLVHEYFAKAWPYVLDNLETSITKGPIDWATFYDN
jgi:uncharacterized protein YndB with AHSA1/START domain